MRLEGYGKVSIKRQTNLDPEKQQDPQLPVAFVHYDGSSGKLSQSQVRHINSNFLSPSLVSPQNLAQLFQFASGHFLTRPLWTFVAQSFFVNKSTKFLRETKVIPVVHEDSVLSVADQKL